MESIYKRFEAENERLRHDAGFAEFCVSVGCPVEEMIEIYMQNAIEQEMRDVYEDVFTCNCMECREMHCQVRDNPYYDGPSICPYE